MYTIDTMISIFTSTRSDGSMKKLNSDDATRVLETRRMFLARHTIALKDTTLVHITYSGEDYTRYLTIDDRMRGGGLVSPIGFESDGLIVTKPGHALFLPLADCIGAVIHDPIKNILMVSHLGRHNLEQFGGRTSIEFLEQHHGVNPEDLTVWLSPAAGGESYPLFAFDNRSLHEVAIEQLSSAGVLATSIEMSPIDVTKSHDYFSHSEFLKGNRTDDGRFAIVAVMR